jgi:alpha-glucosidase
MYPFSIFFRLTSVLGLLFLTMQTLAQNASYQIKSPNGQLEVKLFLEKGNALYYQVFLEGHALIKPSQLGVEQKQVSLTPNQLIAKPAERIQQSYHMFNSKRLNHHYVANSQHFEVRSQDQAHYGVVFQVSDDGVAFRYIFHKNKQTNIEIEQELTSFHFKPDTRAWLQPIALSKSGWEQTNPSYEEHYYTDIPVGTPEPTGAGWVYPALFKTTQAWILLSEAGMDGQYSATRLGAQSLDGNYQIQFPDPKEVMPGEGLKPFSTQDLVSPWRIMTIGSLKTIVESTLGLDVVPAPAASYTGWAKPGRASWSWINSKDNFIVYDEQKKYIDFAADMQWEYCLIDVNWDRKIGDEKIVELANYAKTKNVGLFLWYNSAGSWNTVQYTPKDKLLTRAQREQEFSKLQKWGIKGIKVDFFAGDGQSVIQYYIDLLEDAGKYHLMVNLHGATLPRGWAKTYPHLMTVEAVRGFEMVTFMQEDADRQGVISTILPFTRNVFDPMDFTPMNLSKVRSHVERRTTAGFELATSVLFLSGIQHFAESPEGMADMPQPIKQFLRTLPSYWEEVRYIGGYPGKEVTIARRKGNKWYIAGINAEAFTKKLTLPLTLFEGATKATLYTDSGDAKSWRIDNLVLENQRIETQPNGGFVVVLDIH